MTKISALQPTIIRTERGLSIAGTRVTLYDVIEFVVAGWPAKLIRDRLNLTGPQMAAAQEYIDAHRAEVEAEYQQVLQSAEEARRYWEERNRERFERIAAAPPEAGREELRTKLQAWKSRLEEPE